MLKYKDEVDIRFHMPGHKGHTLKFNELERLRENLFSIDVTEVEGTDNLHVPTGIIKDAQKELLYFMEQNTAFFLLMVQQQEYTV
ncbi:hypothetical protein PL321_06125 [Caloramator sp. mosi_1]|nr:hypothetical protein [Caloramator sp. mosi_1]WDC85644.1 hypothetical protein PL321_06125 [Caloramator sp. mosi_1]